MDLTRRLLLIRALRPDRLIPAMSLLVTLIFNLDLMNESSFDFARVVAHEISSSTPVALCSVPGFDASFRVDNLAKATGTKCISVAMGSPEGFTEAEKAISTASRTAQWVLLKNVHLAPSWLAQLEKRLSGLTIHHHFRLFLTMETNPVIPVNFLRSSRIIMNEPPPGLKANMIESLRGVGSARLQGAPVEAARLYFLFAFFHATVTERLRYTPLGWSKTFEFNDSDAATALDMIESWLKSSAKGRDNLDPALIPWQAIRTLLKESIYGGKIDNSADQRVLDSFVEKIFTPRAFDMGYSLVNTASSDQFSSSLIAPEGSQMKSFHEWVQALPEQQPPEWLGLPPNAERVIATVQGINLLNNLIRMRQLADDDETVDTTTVSKDAPPSGTDTGAGSQQAAAQPAWMKALLGHTSEWLELLPKSIPPLVIDAQGNEQGPLQRFWAREHAAGTNLLHRVRSDLEEVMSVCEGKVRQTNYNRTLLRDLPKGVIPTAWKVYSVPRDMGLSAWVADLAHRMTQLIRVAETMNNAGEEESLASMSVTLGLLFAPGAYMTATRQAASHKAKVSLEHMKLEVELNHRPDPSSVGTDFAITGLKVEGAIWEVKEEADGTARGALVLTQGEEVDLDVCTLRWLPPVSSRTVATDKTAADGPGASLKPLQSPRAPISLYLNTDRSNALFTIALPTRTGDDVSIFAQRAVALRLS